ncbi:MAG: homocysteine S-methyltransferase family protein [Chloroflexi bacterium]|nr:homocysteine S-methyltransferase family protein [Chloroflexota bacterium]
MPSRGILDRLNAGETLLMDGATGSELQRRGVDVSKGATKGNLGVWSATANLDAPGTVRAVHEDYLRLGADILISNSFWTNRPKLAMIGEDERWEEYTRAAGDLAVNARDAVNSEAYVAGGIAPPGMGDLRREFEDQARALTGAGVDLMLAEYVGSIEDSVISVDACATVGLPVCLGLCHVSTDGLMQHGETFTDLARALRGRRVDAVLLMCSSPEAISASLPRLLDVFDGTVGAYANVGYGSNPRFGESAGELWHLLKDDYPPERYAEFAAEWREMGARIIGGCCATTPAHIESIRPVVKG